MRIRLASIVLTLLLALLALGVATSARASDAVFGQPAAEATLGDPITFNTTLTASAQPERVELLLGLPGEAAVTVLPAAISGAGGNWRAAATLDGHVAPNTTFSYRFRVRDPAGGDVIGPEGSITVSDERFAWRTLDGEVVRLHWFEGDDAFGQRALQIGEQAVQRARELLGVTDFTPVDFFIYSSAADLRFALGPGARENVGGQAHPDIRTMFGLIRPDQIHSDWVDTLVAHELTHLVFDSATDNPFNGPPRWLNEGVAVYLSEGYSPTRRDPVERAVERGELIPIVGLGGLFPTTLDEFLLAYGESVSAVDFFVRTYGEEKLWALVRSYAEGVSDDDAFSAATGADVATFNAAWMGSLGVDVPPPFGPQPGPTGPIPPDWTVAQGPTPGPGEPTPIAPRPTPSPNGPPATPADDGRQVVLIAFVVLALALAVVIGLLLIMRRNARRPAQ
jgi:hypothetical protein